MEIWFKEFESHGRQILIKKTHDADESKIGVQYCWPEKLFAVDFGLWIDYDDDDEESFNEAEEARNKLFDTIDQEAVDTAVSNLIQKLKLDN
ncbi:hypothetical protein [Proteus terrae]|uniref:hypothetical protein n=1 Tax=Proteus terrae TaxID=1574161 RepID=UPI001BA6FA60|nr:hypothetical protein [Proteus terrae]QUT00969.1 hypothetical protein KF949_14555 [Proteus terrae subsp. cibarius]